jgi:F-type H+-transporting ATPase subunit a
MNRFTGISVKFALLCSICRAAAHAEQSLADTLFEHVTDAPHWMPVPGLAALPLPILSLGRIQWQMTEHGFMVALVAAGLLALFIPLFIAGRQTPRGISALLEMAVLFVRDDIVFPIMGEARGRYWLSFFTTLFFFILGCNLLGLIPAFKTATGNINVTAALSIMIFVLIFAVGMRRLGPIRFFRSMCPSGMPLPISLLVGFFELLGTMIKAVALALRLFANMFAGHMAIIVFLALMFLLNPFAGLFSGPFALFIYLLEFMIAFIQALVFTLLSCLFITMTSEAGH